MTVEELNRLDAASATREFLRCCGSSRWAGAMTASRPFVDAHDLADRADAVWWSLEPADWREAFAAHPRIGQPSAAPAATPGRGHGNPRRGVSDSARRGLGPAASAEKWSTEEQAGVAGAADDVRERLAKRNREYEARFGYIFIVCATGKSADEMLAILDARLPNDAAAELRIAAEEQRKIARLRLAKLLT